jgi:hypothetical protein
VGEECGHQPAQQPQAQGQRGGAGDGRHGVREARSGTGAEPLPPGGGVGGRRRLEADETENADDPQASTGKAQVHDVP